jgi:L-alanine-DL-glutamate epimerase-like enolase superfamily enzyme
MRITRLRSHSLRNPDGGREAVALVVVEIETDAGLTGLGSVGGFPVGAATIIERQFAPLLVGTDPTDIEAHWERCYASLNRQGQRGTGVMALSGVDLALWDLLGTSVGQPVVRLIGGGSTRRVPVYLSSLSLSGRASRKALLDEVIEGRRRGFSAFKYFTVHGVADGEAGRRTEMDVLREIRSIIGPEADLMVDAHFGWDLPYARRMLEPLADLNTVWLENPIPIDDLAGYEALARDGAVPLAAGESERTRFPFVSLLNAGVYYLQPDINRVGGLTETLRICALAASHQRPVAPHQGWLHTWHLIAARANCPVGEYFPRREPLPGNALIWAALDGEPEAEDGMVTIPERPGFGWRLNARAIATYDSPAGER